MTLTTADLFRKWLAYKANFLCVRTIKWYAPTAALLEQCFGDREAATITKADIGLLIGKLKQSGLVPETQRRKLEGLKACWDWAIECEILNRNPWKGVAKLIKVPPLEPPQPFTAGEMAAIIEGFEQHERYRQLTPFVRFLFGTGVRTSEAIGLRWGDLSEDCTIFSLKTQLTRGVRKPTKTGRSRILKLPASIAAMLMEMRPQKPDKQSLVFQINGRPIRDDGFQRDAWAKILKAQSVPYRKPYCTRATFISHAIEKGLSPTTVAGLCGNSPRVIYSHYLGNLNTGGELPEII